MINFRGGILFYRFKKIIDSLVDLVLFALMRNRIKQLCKRSLLWAFEHSSKSSESCPICNNGKVKMLIKMPLGYPIRQNHTLLYYDYDAVQIEPILRSRVLLDRTAGFFLSVQWNFCQRCKNASLDINFSEKHLNRYFSKYFVRFAKSGDKRRNVKEKHGRYIDSFLKRSSKILEIGSAEGYAASYLAEREHKVWVYEPSVQFRSILIEKRPLNFIDDFHNLENNFFDCIYLHHVFEHISHPSEYSKILFNLLKRGGFLFIQSPDLSLQLPLYHSSLKRSIYCKFNPFILNFKSYDYIIAKLPAYHWLDALNNDHLSAFTLEGLTHLLEVNGFRIKLACQTIKNRLQFDYQRFAWPVDIENGNTPNGLTIVAEK